MAKIELTPEGMTPEQYREYKAAKAEHEKRHRQEAESGALFRYLPTGIKQFEMLTQVKVIRGELDKLRESASGERAGICDNIDQKLEELTTMIKSMYEP